MTIEMQPVGVIRSPFHTRSDLRFADYSDKSVRTTLVLEPRFLEGAADLHPGDYAVLLFYFNQSQGYTLTPLSRKAGVHMGVFSTRSPDRPNGIGMTIVQFTKVEGTLLEFRGVDMLDGTPVLDIKPYDGEHLPVG